MRWVAYLELRGLYAAVHRGRGSLGSTGSGGEVPLIVLRDGRVWDGCPRAWNQGLQVEMPRRQALRQVPGALTAEYGKVDYTAAVRALRDRAAAFSGRVEPVSDYQVFLDLSGPNAEPPRRELADLMAAAAAAVARVAGIPAAELLPLAGGATSKLVARAAALHAPPGEPAAVSPGQEAAFLAPLPVGALWRVRPELRERLQRLGLVRVGDVARVPEVELQRQFGPEGREMARWARGNDPEPVAALWPPRVLARRAAFAEGAAPQALAPLLPGMVRELARELDARSEVARAVSVEVEWTSTRFHGRRSLPRRTWTETGLMVPLQGLLQQALRQAPRGSRALALQTAAEDLMPASHQQLNLWGLEERQAEERAQRLEQALDLLRARFPARWVRVGAQDPAAHRREAMAAFYDPLRWAAAPAGESRG